MAAMKPRTGEGPMEVAKEGRSLIMRIPLEGGGRLVLEITKDEAQDLKECLDPITQYGGERSTRPAVERTHTDLNHNDRLRPIGGW